MATDELATGLEHAADLLRRGYRIDAERIYRQLSERYPESVEAH